VTAERLLHALADGGTHSVEDLARSLDVTSAAVSRQVAEIAQWGLAVQALPGPRYRLPRRLDLVDAGRLRAALDPAVIARLATLEVSMRLASTNERLLSAPPPLGSLDVCVAELQTAGRGRRGRRWHTPLASGVALSVGWQFAGVPPQPAALALAVGVAVRRALQEAAGLTIALKWPNDLVFDERKLGGILLETKAGTHVVAGVGVNVSVPADVLPTLSDWPRGAIDLATALGKEPPPRTVLAGALVNALAALFADYSTQGFGAYRSEYGSADYLRGRAIRLDAPAERLLGTARGIDSDGALLVETEAGERRRVVAGDVTVRSAQ
jgi:BirA family biotin operon repressor/biotin-[acetyl-CoA-carboxylase] ligase